MSEAILRDVQKLAELFKAGGWKELRVEFPGGSLLLSEDLSTPSLGGTPVAAPAPVPVVPASAVATPAAPAQTAAPFAVASAPVDPAWTAIVAPNLGTFYRAPKPGSPPFVEVGQRVTAETEICLIEVMKLFTSVKAGVAGTIRQVCAEDAQLVEGGTILFYIGAD